MQTRLNRKLPNHFLRIFMQAIEAETGTYSLRMMLRNAGLETYVAELPPDNKKTEISAQAFADLQAAIREYFGNGARGSLNRIGRVTWEQLTKNASLPQRAKLTASRALPANIRARQALEFLAEQIGSPDGQVSVHLLDHDLIFMDTSSDSTYGQTDKTPICWATLGMLQAALLWATDNEQNVDEISCRATGADACRFRIKPINE